MDRKAFYAALRKRDSGVFGTSLSRKQVDGTENLLDVWEEYYSDDPVEYLASDLGTAYLETGHTMQPITERGRRSYFNKYEPGTPIGRVLGNTLKGDGYRYRGEGHVMNTGRRNAGVATKRLNEVFGLHLDLVARPHERGDPFVSAHSLFLGNKEGWWTGKELSDYIDGVDEGDDEDLREFINARRVVNGTDRARDIGRYSLAFERALRAAGGFENKPREHAQPHSSPYHTKTTTNAYQRLGWSHCRADQSHFLNTWKEIIMKVDQPSLKPTNKLSAAVVVSLAMELSRVVVSAVWPDFYDPNLWIAITPIAVIAVGYFIKDDLNA